MNCKSHTVQLGLFLAVLLALLTWPAGAEEAEEGYSWLSDDPTQIYHEGTLSFLGDPTGAGLSVYDNYVFYVKGDTYLRSKWKNTNLLPDGGWAWGSGDAGGWAYTQEGTFVGYQISPPTYIYLGAQRIPYTSYVSTPMYDEVNHLYIQGENSWTRRVVAPLGSAIWLLAYTKTGGPAELYTTIPDGSVSVESIVMPAGYSHMSFNAAVLGRHLIAFVKDNVPSEAVVVDVVPESSFFAQTAGPVVTSTTNPS